MQKAAYKHLAGTLAILAIVTYFWMPRPADAAIFNFDATCIGPCDPILGPEGSLVTGTLDLNAAALIPGGDINGADILSFSLSFQTFGPLTFNPAFVGPSGDPVGNLNLIGDAIERLSIFDSLGQFFTVDLSSEGGNASWTVLTFVGGQPVVGTGTNPSFVIAPAIPEPESQAIFLFSLAFMAFLARRQRWN